jgi:pSer/pThr/pTyr-binding forkhead associated (FHA) protein
MFSLHELANRLGLHAAQQYRLVPLDWWADTKPIPFQAPAVVGRSSKADVRLTDPWISRVHCELSLQDGKLLVRDLESRHGVFVNEQRVRQAELHPGDVLLLGVTRFRLEYDSTPAPAQQGETT